MRNRGTIKSRSGFVAARGVLAVYAFLLLYDGAIRKWLLPQVETYIFVLKDVFLVFGLAYVLVARERIEIAAIHRAVLPWVVLYFLWIVLSTFNPWLPNWAVAVWGLKTYALVAIALVVLVPLIYSESETVLRSLVQLFPWVVLPICLLGILQVFAPVDSVLNKQVRDDVEAIVTFGSANLVRVSGTFSYISGMTSFVQAAALLGFSLFLSGARNRFFLVALGVVFASLPITGSRGIIVTVAASAAVMLTVAAMAGLVPIKRAIAITLVGSLLASVSFYFLETVWIALEERADTSFGEANRYVTVFTNAFDYFDDAGLAGFGTGSANLGAPMLVSGVAPFSWIPGNVAFEEESGRTVLELGIVGWVFSLGMRLALSFWALALALRGRSLGVRAIGVLATPVMLVAFYIGIGVFAAPIWSAYVWFCVALLAVAQRENSALNLKCETTRAAQLYDRVG